MTSEATNKSTMSPTILSTSSSSGTPSTSDDDGETEPSQIEKQKTIQSSKSAISSISPSTPTSVTIERRDSSSTADIPSEVLLMYNGDQRTSSQKLHEHKLPSGWACNYDPETDEYNFELMDQQKQPQLQQAGLLATTTYTTKTTQERGSPTRDYRMQTSRKTTFHLFECQYGYHFPSSPTSSMISELAHQVQKSSAPGAADSKLVTSKTRHIGYGKTKLVVPSDAEDQKLRIRDIFPTATEPVIEQMIRIYHGREGLIKAALISLGYKRASEFDNRQTIAQSPVMLMMSKPSSKKLFEKLSGYFPDKDENLIKSLMYKHKEVEHEIISALVESGHIDNKTLERQSAADELAARTGKNGAIMKLRYLKVLYPTCEEIELYHLLNCNDLNAQKVMEIVEKRGHKRANIEEVMQKRKSQTQQMRAQQAAHAAKDKPPSAAQDLVDAHKKRVKPAVAENKLKNLKASVKKNFEHFEDGLIMAALVAADYNEGLAKKFLNEMDPIDESLFMQRYQLPRETPPNVVAFPCKAIQKSDTNFMSIVSNEYVFISREIIECEHALALLKVDASTYTQEDFPKTKFTHRIGKKLDLACGPQYADLIHYRLQEQKARRSNLHVCQRIGSVYKEICSNQERPKPNSRAKGSNKTLVSGRNGSIRMGHNSRLLERTHPFFVTHNNINN